MKCKICEKTAKRRGFCDKHYERWRVHGDPLKVKDRKPTLDILRERMKLIMSKPNNNKCINYLGTKHTSGYGVFSFFGKTLYAHRAAYELFVGKIPHDKMICHSCDNRLCVNVDHLWIGNHDDNMKDMVLKKRSSYGTRNTKCKLSEDQVINIKKRLIKGEKLISLAKEYNVSYVSIADIKKGNHWKHINV